jgi:hypothetical protein
VNLLALALVMGMVWKMKKKVYAAVTRNVDIFQENLKNHVPPWKQFAFLNA